MRISDWSSDVCSSDLAVEHQPQHPRRQHLRLARPRGRAEPDMAFGIGGGALPRVERRETGGLAYRSPSPRPNHSSRRINRSEEHTSELQTLMRISYAVFCLKKKNHIHLPLTRR